MSSIFAVLAVVFSHFVANGFSSEIGHQYPHGSLACKRHIETVWDCSSRMLVNIPSHVLNKAWTNQPVHGMLLYKNKLENITGAPFKNVSTLTWMSLGYNMISTISEDAFSGLYQLGYLKLNNNKLASLKQDVFHDLTKLYYLDLSYNLFQIIPSHTLAPLKSLQQLLLKENYIISFALGKEFQNLTQLTLLDLRGCCLDRNQWNPLLTSSISNETFQYLNSSIETDLTLQVSWNNKVITKITSFGSLNSVKHLDVQEKPLDDFTSAKCKLESLSLSEFPFHNGTLEPFRFTERWNATLRKLSITSTRVTELPRPLFHWMPQLQILELSYHYLLRSISDDAFYGLNFLEELILSHNNLIEVPSRAAEGIHRV